MAPGDAGGYQVDPMALEQHAGAVDGIATHVEQARQAGASVLVGADAYGFLCSFLPALLRPAQQQTVDTLAEIASGLRTAASGVRAAAQSYAQLDDAAATGYRQVSAR